MAPQPEELPSLNGHQEPDRDHGSWISASSIGKSGKQSGEEVRMIYGHLVWATRGRTVLFADERQLLLALGRFIGALGEAVLLFAVVDDHAHVVVAADAVSLSRKRCAWGRILATSTRVALQPSHLTEVSDRRHLQRLVGYLLRQDSRHGIGAPGRLWPGSCLPDLLLARRFPGFDAGALRRAMPRLRDAELLNLGGVGAEPLRPFPAEGIRAAGIGRIAAAAAASAGLADLRGRHRRTIQARVAAVHLARNVGIHPREVAHGLNLPPRSLRWCSARAPDPGLLTAIPRMLALEARVEVSALRTTG